MATRKVGRPRVAEEDKCKPNDRLVCPICNEVYIRACKSRHNKTKVHQAYLKMHDRANQVIRDELQPAIMKRVAAKMLEAY